MKRKLKDKKIMIYKKESSGPSAPIGGYTAKWKPIHLGSLWAYVRQLSQTELFTARTLLSEEELLFVVNWRADIDVRHYVLHKETWYNIVRVDTFEAYKSDLTIYAKEMNLGGIPKPEDIIPYDG